VTAPTAVAEDQAGISSLAAGLPDRGAVSSAAAVAPQSGMAARAAVGAVTTTAEQDSGVAAVACVAGAVGCGIGAIADEDSDDTCHAWAEEATPPAVGTPPPPSVDPRIKPSICREARAAGLGRLPCGAVVTAGAAGVAEPADDAVTARSATTELLWGPPATST